MQVPPAHSAKRIGGKKAYELARRAKPVALAPVTMTVRALERLSRDGDRIELRVTASAGFYVRALARDLGARLGCGAHLASLRRTRSGHFEVAAAIPLEAAEQLGTGLADRLIRPADALPHLPSVRLTAAGLRRVSHGNPVGPEHLEGGWVPATTAPGPVKILGSRRGPGGTGALAGGHGASVGRAGLGPRRWALGARALGPSGVSEANSVQGLGPRAWGLFLGYNPIFVAVTAGGHCIRRLGPAPLPRASGPFVEAQHADKRT